MKLNSLIGGLPSSRIDTEYYWVMILIGMRLKPTITFDIGTREGWSANVLAGVSKRVITFDIDPKEGKDLRAPNIEFVVRNLLTDPPAETYLKPDLIFLDVDPHDGIQEKEFIKLFEERCAVKGKPLYVIFDDIRLTPGMVQFWTWLGNRPNWETLDITHEAGRYGAGFGLGVYTK